MKERPILFSAPMVRSILDGTKTQTRRVVKPSPEQDQQLQMVVGSSGLHYVMDQTPIAYPETRRIRWDCPYGQPGDRLWVREAFRLVKTLPGGAAGDFVPPSMVLDSTRKFEADGATSLPDRVFGKLRPGIHMPRWASRITLEITGVRVEQLQDISEADALAEGIRDINPYRGLDQAYARAFSDLWESINGPESWEANPWVWVVEFKRVEGCAA